VNNGFRLMCDMFEELESAGIHTPEDLKARLELIRKQQAPAPPAAVPVRRMQGNPHYSGSYHYVEHDECYNCSTGMHGCVPVAPEPASVPSVYGCPPEEVPIPEGWEFVEFRAIKAREPYLTRERRIQERGPDLDCPHKRRIIVRRKPTPSVPSVDAPEAPRVRRWIVEEAKDPESQATYGKFFNAAGTQFAKVTELTPADASREQAVQALVEAVDADLLDTIADSGERCESMDGFGSSTLKHLAYLKRAIPGK